MALVSLINKSNISYPIINLSDIAILFILGYGIYIVYSTIKGKDKLPKVKSYKRLLWEGFKKYLVITFYTIFLTYLSYYAKFYFAHEDYILTAICIIMFNLIWIFLTGALLNKFLKKNFFKAFAIFEIIKLLRSFNLKNFILLILVILITQFTIINVFIDFHHGIETIDICYSILTFFLAPFLFISNKRLVAIQIKRLLEDQ